MAYKHLRSGWGRLLGILRKKFGSFPYIQVVEFQQNGSPHLHILIKGDMWIDVVWLRNLWEKKYGLGTMVRVEFIPRDCSYRAVAYLSKYLKKSLEFANQFANLNCGGDCDFEKSSSPFPSTGGGVPQWTGTAVICWALGVRSFSVGGILDKYMTNSYQKRAGEWIFMGCHTFGGLCWLVDCGEIHKLTIYWDWGEEVLGNA